MFGWWRKKTVEQSPRPDNPFLHIEMTLDGKLSGFAHLPVQSTEQQTAQMATNFAAMLSLLNSGKLLPLLQRAVSVGSVMEGRAGEGLSLYILNMLNRASGKAEQGKLVVRPTEAFNPRPHGVPLND